MTNTYKLGWKKPKSKRYKILGLSFTEPEMIGTSADMHKRGLDVKVIPKSKKPWVIKSV
jgi:hypothetical protein